MHKLTMQNLTIRTKDWRFIRCKRQRNRM